MTGEKERFQELEQRLQNHDGELVRRELEGLNRSGTVLHTNFVQLQRNIEQFEQNWKQMIAEDVKADGAPHQNEFLRMLHNYLASVSAMYDHTQRVRKKFNNRFDTNEFNDAYYTLLEKYEIKQKNKFMIDFRNYTQHYKLPLPTRRLHLDVTDRMTGEFDQYPQITFEVENLKEWDGWKSDSKEVMDDFEDGHILLKDIVEEFQKSLKSFHNDLYEAASRIFQEELWERDRIVYQMHQIKPDDVELSKEEIESVEEHFEG